MTEHEWLTATNPWGIESVRNLSDRKLRLFTCACCRQVLNSFVPRVVERALAAAEAFADGEITADTLTQVHAVVHRVFAGARDDARRGSGYWVHLSDACGHACWPKPNKGETRAAGKAALAAARASADVPWPASGELHRGCPVELAAQAELVRDVFGNPFREVAFDHAWRTADVLAIAQGMYSNRDFSAMPILADALQDAGCDEEDILNHCRDQLGARAPAPGSPGPLPHVRGCWVVDLVLGKE